ncbi:MAG: type II secretion system inner membrane protein GspF [Arenicellales bacterium]
MAAYEYQALDDKGHTREGVLTGDTPRQVRQMLRDQGLVPLSLNALSENVVQGQVSTSRKRIPPAELAVITRQFSTLLGAGLTIEESLEGLIEQADSHRIRSILTSIRSSVMEGQSLSDAIGEFPAAFPSLYRASLHAGEETGRLDDVLERLADYMENTTALKRRILIALIYPIILTLVAILIVTGLLTYVVPKVVKVFEESGQTLPLLTRGMIAISDFLQNWGLWILLALFLGGIAFHFFFKQPGPKLALHKFLLGVPMLSSIIRNLNTSVMARTLAIMSGSGVPLLSAMTASSRVVNNLAMRQAMEQARIDVGEGMSLNKALKKSKLFPPLLTQMVASGESSGKLAQMLEKSAEVQENELEARTSIMVGLFEPMMILVMGAVVLVIVLAILLPIFDLNELIYAK